MENDVYLVLKMRYRDQTDQIKQKLMKKCMKRKVRESDKINNSSRNKMPIENQV